MPWRENSRLTEPYSSLELPVHESLAINSPSDSQYHYHQDPSKDQSYYVPPPSSPLSPAPTSFQPHFYNNDPYAPNEQAYGNQEYPSQYASPSATSSSTDPELKRIRNTAASARFRAKKRRETSLERNAKEKREALARRELEAENRFLKGLNFDSEKLQEVKRELERVRELKRGLEMEGSEGERDDGVGT